jgi:hypothetical protein
MSTHQPTQDEYRSTMQDVAASLDRFFNGDVRPRQTGFVLLVFPFGHHDGQRCNYISNGSREDIVVMLKEMVARFEGQPEQAGQA